MAIVRRLTAIPAVGTVGFPALMTQDKVGTLRRLIAFRRKQFDPRVAAHRGRVVKLMGDGALMEFPSVVDAVSCAIAIQTQIAAAPDKTIQLRIGVNLGDVLTADFGHRAAKYRQPLCRWQRNQAKEHGYPGAGVSRALRTRL